MWPTAELIVCLCGQIMTCSCSRQVKESIGNLQWRASWGDEAALRLFVQCVAMAPSFAAVGAMALPVAALDAAMQALCCATTLTLRARALVESRCVATETRHPIV